jgi:hypothetical protein
MFCKTLLNIKPWSFLLVLLSIFPLISSADYSLQPLTAESPGLYLKLETLAGRDDNTYRTNDETAVSDAFLRIKPEITWLSLVGKHRFNLAYQGDYGHYSKEDALDYDDHELLAHALFDHSYRLKSEYTLGHVWDHYHPGETESLYIANDDTDEWEEGYAKARFSYGRHDSQGQVIGQLAYRDRHYDKEEQEFRDYTLLDVTAALYYRIASRSRVLLESRLLDFDYGSDDAIGRNQTNKDYRYLAGITWEATAKTTGIFKIGYRDKQYKSDQFDDITGLALWLEAEWQPNTYTSVTLGAYQDTRESALQGRRGYVRQSIHVGVEHEITPLTLVYTEAQYGQDKFDFGEDREDDRWRLILGLEYSLLRWMDLGAEFRREARNSNLEIYDFSANLIMLTARVKFSY